MNVDRENTIVGLFPKESYIEQIGSCSSVNFEPKVFKQSSYIFSISIVKSAGFRLFPQVLHFPSMVRKMSLMGLRLIILDIVVPHLPQIISVEG